MNYVKFLRRYVGHESCVGLFLFNEKNDVLMQLRTDYNTWRFIYGSAVMGLFDILEEISVMYF